MIDEILEMRMWWSIGIIVFGVIVPFFTLCFFVKKEGDNKGKWWFIAFVIYAPVFVAYSPNIIPKKYDVKTIKVKECFEIEKIVPKYPNGFSEK